MPRLASSGRLLDGDVSGGRDFNNMAKVLDAFPAAAHSFVEILPQSLDHPGVNLLGKAVENFIDSTAVLIPKKRLDFLVSRSASSGRSLSTKVPLCLNGSISWIRTTSTSDRTRLAGSGNIYTLQYTRRG